MKDAKEIINKMIADMEWHKTVNDDCQYQMGIDHCIDIVRCSEKYFENEIPQTNADKIRSMSDAELAKENIYFVSALNAKEGLHYTGLDGHYYRTAEEVVEANMKWLQSEVEELLEVGE